MRLYVSFGGWCAGIALLAAASAAQGAEGLCDRSLASPADDAQGYRVRGDRCEGRYLRQVTSTTIWPVSFIEVFEAFDAGRDKNLMVSWPVASGAAEVSVRAESVKRRQYFRMDTRRPVLERQYTWPTQMLSALELLATDLGVLASTSLPVAATPRTVYLPARVTRGASAETGASYTLSLMPGIQLEELTTALFRVEASGGEAVVRAPAPLRYGYYPAQRAVTIDLPKALLPGAGVYRMELVARLPGGGSSRSDVWLYHPGP